MSSADNKSKSTRKRIGGWFRKRLGPTDDGQSSAPDRQNIIASMDRLSHASPSCQISTLIPELAIEQSHGHDKLPPTRTTTEPVGDNKAWTSLLASLKKLKGMARLIPSVADAAGVLLDCFDAIEAAAKSQQDYEDLATELAVLSDILAQQIEGMGRKQYRSRDRKAGRRNQEKEGERKGETTTAGEFGRGRCDATLSANRVAVSAAAGKPEHEYMECRERSDGEHTTGRSGTGEAGGIRLSTLGNQRTCDILDERHGGHGQDDDRVLIREWLKQHELLAGSFFCTRTSAACRDVAKIVPTVVYQLARYSATFQSILYDILSADPDAATKNITNQFESLLKEALEKTRGKGKGDAFDNLVIVIDALDECEDPRGVETILDRLFQYAPHLGLKFFVTSRPEPGIYAKMSANVGCRGGMVLHDIETSLVSKDIELYLEQELASIPLRVPESDLKQLVDRSGALFIYAATLVRYIRTAKRSVNPYDRLQSILASSSGSSREHAQIDKLYLAVLESALEDEELEHSEREAILAVLHTVLMTQQPIRVETIALLAGIDGPERVEYALAPLRSVLHQSESTGLVSTLHASFPDFMFSHTRSGSYFCDIGKHSPGMAHRCFTVMKDQLRFNICDLPSSFIPDENVDNLQDRIKHRISPSLAYVCRYWASHVSLAPANDDLREDMSVFLSERLLFWMEVMSLRRELLAGIEGFLALKQWLRVSGSTLSDTVTDVAVHKKTNSQKSEVATLIEDASNFYTSYASSPACHCTSHIYISCLPFCPRSSTVYKHYWPRMQGLVELKGSLMDRRETAALATWNIPSPVWSVAYSGDGSQVAVGCLDGTVSIRNAYDGTLLVGPWNAHTDVVRSVVFSPDGRLVASGSDDRTIGVWDVRTGSSVADPFHGRTGNVFSVSFSPDSKRIVSGSDDNTVCIWDTANGTLLVRPLRSHTDSVRFVTFSPDGTLIASASKDKTIRLWRSDDGTPATSPLQGHTHSVNSVTFTPDGTWLVSGSDDGTVRVWRVSDGSAVATPFQGHSGGVYSVAVSADGMLVASGSDDCTVRVWRMSDGSLAAVHLLAILMRFCQLGTHRMGRESSLAL
ncbi:WD40 repeat-like protein [Rhizoctonia solani]|uniref:WD40 repeat-like protein n=1 Tax=Rhizoctonia solani TaxID=456999 RepID=A0A8H7M5X6_9AGAM|nr:WD40 repeat-like protein [Rhizoctonia solani]